MTGANRHATELGIRIGWVGLELTYDTTPRLPVFPAPVPYGEFTDFVQIDSDVFGQLWSSNLHKRLVVVAGADIVNAARGDGTVVSFQSDGSGGFISPVGIDDKLVTTASGYLYIDAAGAEEKYDATGKLLQIYRRDGNRLDFKYSDATTPPSIAPGVGYLIEIDDAFGRAVSFTYAGSQIAQASDANGQVTKFSYVGVNLTSITWPDTYSLGFRFDRTDLPWAMTGVVDENSATEESFGYDTAGRATSTQMASGVGLYSVDYGASAPAISATDTYNASTNRMLRTLRLKAGLSTVVTEPAIGQGARTVVPGTDDSLGAARLKSLSQPAGSGCAASTSSQAFDARGNTVLQDDFNGNRTCAAFDAVRNLQTVLLEGRSSAVNCPADPGTYAPIAPDAPGYDAAHPERKTVSAWHPNWALLAKQAQPLKITAWSYNGQGGASCAPVGATLPDGQPIAVLCARTEQATSDATGGNGLGATLLGNPKTWSYTYNAFGQVLTETAPPQTLGDAPGRTTTTYSYYTDTSFDGSGRGHTIGDLQQVVNPLGQATQYTSYDRVGRLLSSSDPNGVVTSQTYWPRGWLHAQTVTSATGSSLTTTFDYWPTGLLHVVTLPNAVTLTYQYDDAHRLTDVTDSAGNTVHYALDNAGNRTGEDVKDASGRLASTIARVFDNLERLQSVTGAMH